jgi:acyl-CoA synthetase (AMP-forming)/AMP-acid ligase II
MGIFDFTIYQLIQRNAKIYSDRSALISGDVKVTYRQLLDRVDRLAAGLQQAGIEKGDRLGVIAENCLEFMYLFGAAAKIGALMLPVNWRLQPEEVEHVVSDATPKLLITGPGFQDLTASLAAKFDFIDKIYTFGSAAGEFVAFQDLMESSGEIDDVEINDSDDYLIIHTAAISGKPRGGVLTHQNLIAANIQSMVAWNLSAQDCHLCVLPMFHIAGLGACMNLMHVGGSNIILSKFDPDTALKHIQEDKVSMIPVFPPILSTLLERNKEQNYDLTSLRIVVGLDTPETIQQYEAQTGGTFWTGFGQTETTGIITYGIFREKPGAAGIPGVLTELEIMDESGNIAKEGETGEIVIRGPVVFRGYWNLTRETEYTFRDGWHHTGDMGRLDGNRYLFYTGRMPEKELIKSGGENVYPSEVEKIILEHPLITETCVIGVEDEQWGEAVKAVCVLAKEERLTEKELAEFVASKIARYKKPRYVSYVSALPKNEDGSIDRAKVKAAYGRK